MVDSTTVFPILNSTGMPVIPIDQLMFIFQNPVLVVRMYQIAYIFTFLLGIPGSFASIFTFSRRKLRHVSTGCLFIALAMSDVLYLIICFIDFVEFGLGVRLYYHLAYDHLCRFRSFTFYVSQVASAWILVLVAIDRWVRTRFPFKATSICTPKHALAAVGILVVIDVGLHSHLLSPLFGTLIPGFAIASCGPDVYNQDYFQFYTFQWGVMQIFMTPLVPALIMLLTLIDIHYYVHVRRRVIVQPIHNVRESQQAKRQRNLQKQMFILMFTCISIFMATSLPAGIYKLLSPRGTIPMESVFYIIIVWTILNWIQSLFHAINFYVYCLSSTLFRREFQGKIKAIWTGRAQTTVLPFSTTGQAHLRY